MRKTELTGAVDCVRSYFINSKTFRNQRPRDTKNICAAHSSGSGSVSLPFFHLQGFVLPRAVSVPRTYASGLLLYHFCPQRIWHSRRDRWEERTQNVFLPMPFAIQLFCPFQLKSNLNRKEVTVKRFFPPAITAL